jgi:hypothetical protein
MLLFRATCRAAREAVRRHRLEQAAATFPFYPREMDLHITRYRMMTLVSLVCASLFCACGNATFTNLSDASSDASADASAPTDSGASDAKAVVDAGPDASGGCPVEIPTLLAKTCNGDGGNPRVICADGSCQANLGSCPSGPVAGLQCDQTSECATTSMAACCASLAVTSGTCPEHGTITGNFACGFDGCPAPFLALCSTSAECPAATPTCVAVNVAAYKSLPAFPVGVCM